MALSALTIGIACEEAQQAIYDRMMWAEYESRPDIIKIRQLQEDIKRPRARFFHPPPPEKLTPQAVRNLNQLGRLRSLRLARPLNVRETVCADIAARFSISPHSVERYWKRYRAMLKQAKLELDP